MRLGLAVLVAVAMTTGVPPARAQSAAALPAAAGARPDFSGYWALRLDGISTPAARLTAEATAQATSRATRDAEALAQCVNIGVPALMDDRAVLDIRHSPRLLAMMAKTVSSMRYVYTDGRTRPPADEVELTTNGLSIGTWDGDTLVVETAGFNDRGVTRIPGGGYRTRRARLIERFRLLNGGRQLSVTFTWTDASVFTSPHTYEFRYDRVADAGEPRTFRCFESPDRTRFLTAAPPSR